MPIEDPQFFAQVKHTPHLRPYADNTTCMTHADASQINLSEISGRFGAGLLASLDLPTSGMLCFFGPGASIQMMQYRPLGVSYYQITCTSITHCDRKQP